MNLNLLLSNLNGTHLVFYSLTASLEEQSRNFETHRAVSYINIDCAILTNM